MRDLRVKWKSISEIGAVDTIHARETGFALPRVLQVHPL